MVGSHRGKRSRNVRNSSPDKSCSSPLWFHGDKNTPGLGSSDIVEIRQLLIEIWPIRVNECNRDITPTDNIISSRIMVRADAGGGLMNSTQITLALLLALFSYPCHSQFAPESLGDALSKDIVNRERLAWEATRTKDKAGLAALLSEDFTEITDDGVFDKTQILANLDHLTVTSYSPRNVRVRKLAPDAVMLIFQVTVEGNYHGHNFHADSNAASLWMKRGGKWLTCTFKKARCPPPDPRTPGYLMSKQSAPPMPLG